MRLTGLWWWIDRWRKSTAFTEMNLEEQGAYRNLIDEAALRGGPIPNDEDVLARACGDARKWRRVRPAVMKRFELQADGWHNETLDEVIAESKRRADKQRKYRNKGHEEGNESGNAHGNAPGNNQRPPDPDPVNALPERAPGERRTHERRAAPAQPLVSMREHRAHAYCGRPCVPDFLHRQFVDQLGSAVPDPDLTVRQFYVETSNALPEDAVIAYPVKFWESRFGDFIRAKFPNAQGLAAVGAGAPRQQAGSGRTGAENAHLYDIGRGRHGDDE